MLRAKIAALIISVFGIHAHAALTVATCESRLQPHAVNADNFGLFQIAYVHHRQGESVARFRRRMFSVRANVHTAFVLSRGGRDWDAWTCQP